MFEACKEAGRKKKTKNERKKKRKKAGYQCETVKLKLNCTESEI